MSRCSKLIKQGYFVDGTEMHYRKKHKNGVIHNDWRVGREKYNVDKSSCFFHNDYVWFQSEDDESDFSSEFGINKMASSFDGDFNDFVSDEYDYD